MLHVFFFTIQFVMPSNPVWRCNLIWYHQLLIRSQVSKIFFVLSVQSVAPCPPALPGLVCSSSPLRSWSNCRLNADICLKVCLPLQWTPAMNWSLCASVCIHHIFCDCLFGKDEVNCPLPGNSTQWQMKEKKKKPSSIHVHTEDTQREHNDLWRSSVVTICQENWLKDWDALKNILLEWSGKKKSCMLFLW